MTRDGLWFVLAAGCTSVLPMGELPCTPEEEVLDPADPSHLGFSADDAAAWFGDAATVDVTWSGRHSRTPATDTFDVVLGPIDGEVVAHRNTPRGDAGTEAECAALDRLVFTRTITVSSRDGEVTGAGSLQLALADQSVATAELDGSASDLTLADARWLEVDKALSADLAPPETVSLWFHADPTWGESVSIAAEGPNYTVRVWNCDDQRGECATWRWSGRR